MLSYGGFRSHHAIESNGTTYDLAGNDDRFGWRLAALGL